ncbi:MAG: squalene/phytoene synthase family protein, partial [Planctomycetes bacterium]|nr:squalene/phytoene synthase family protein [Planctomycetota bacterium]
SWTRHHARAPPAPAGAPVEQGCARGVRLGQGLQLVNVLRDLPRDLAAGRCYLPRTELAAAGLAPADLREPVRSWPRVRPIVGRWIERALGHFAAGREYVLALPPGERRLRLCTWWPLALGLQTLAMLRRSPNLLEPGRVEKVRRGAVYRLLLSSFLRGASDAYVQSAFDRWSAAAAHAEPIVELPAP